MARTRVRWGRVAGLAAAVTLAVGAASGAAHAGDAGGPRRSLPRETTSRSYVVRPGDTLWAIAARLAGPRADPRPQMDVLAALNHTDGRLVPGQIIRLPES